MEESKNKGLGRSGVIRLIVIGVLILIAGLAFSHGVGQLLKKDAGYMAIECTASAANLGDQFVLIYNLGESGIDPTKENKQITMLYNEMMVRYYRLFSVYETFEELNNMASINAAPGEPVTVDAPLYDSLKLMTEKGGRYIYMGPVYELYENIFYSSYDEDAAYWDPAENPEMASYLEELLAYINSGEHISLELGEDNTVTLHISPEYLAFAEENGTGRFLDFGWMENAFVADLFAGNMTGAGFTAGSITSLDGYARCFDVTGEEYHLDIFDMRQGDLKNTGTVSYSRPAAFCTLRSFALEEIENELWMYTYESGKPVTRYISSEDGYPHDGYTAVTGYSDSSSAAEILLSILPYYQSGNMDEMTDDRIGAVWSDGEYLSVKELAGFTFE